VADNPLQAHYDSGFSVQYWIFFGQSEEKRVFYLAEST